MTVPAARAPVAGDLPVVVAHDVFCLYPTPRGHVAALRGLSLAVAAGERVVVHGPNGSGKTTLLRVLAGEQAPSAGTVVVAGVDLVGAEDAQRCALRSAGLGLVDQHHARTLRPEMDVRDNVALQLRVAGHSRAGARDRAVESLESLDLGHLARRHTYSLSGGEAQRVAVCAALAHRPRLVLADEPTGELDRAAADAVYDLLVRATAAVGASLVVVSHDLGAARIADRVVRIRDGRLSEEWTPGTAGSETLVVDDRGWLRLPEPLRRSTGLSDAVTAEGGDGTIVLRRSHRARLPAGAGAPAPAHLVRSGRAPVSAARAGPAAELDRVGAIRGGRAVLTDLSLVIRPGRLLVVQGRSGSGKTTLLRLLTGLEPPDSGAVRVAGTDLAGLDRAGLARLRREHLAVAGQSGSLVEALDVRANLELVRDARGLPVHSDSDGDSDGGLPDGGLPDGGLPDGVDGWVESMGLTPLRHRPVRLLSGGERQRVVVARVLVTEAPLAVLDEPTSAQDEAGAERLVAVLVAAAARGIAVVVATHDPILVAAADDVVTLG